MIKRAIRLKEYTPNIDQWCPPSEEYLKGTDSTFSVSPFRCRSGKHGFIETGNTSLDEDQPLIFLGDSIVESTFGHESERFASVTERLSKDQGLSVRCPNGACIRLVDLHPVTDGDPSGFYNELHLSPSGHQITRKYRNTSHWRCLHSSS